MNNVNSQDVLQKLGNQVGVLTVNNTILQTENEQLHQENTQLKQDLEAAKHTPDTKKAGK